MKIPETFTPLGPEMAFKMPNGEHVLMWVCDYVDGAITVDVISGFDGRNVIADKCNWRCCMPMEGHPIPESALLRKPHEPATTHSGNKYLVEMRDYKGRKCMVYDSEREEYIPALVDYYSIEKACEVPRGGITHAGKKILFGGRRGKGSLLQDLKEARDALTREIAEMEQMEREGNANA